MYFRNEKTVHQLSSEHFLFVGVVSATKTHLFLDWPEMKTVGASEVTTSLYKCDYYYFSPPAQSRRQEN